MDCVVLTLPSNTRWIYVHEFVVCMASVIHSKVRQRCGFPPIMCVAALDMSAREEECNDPQSVSEKP